MAQNLLQLSDIICDAAAKINSICLSRSMKFPELNEPLDLGSETIRLNADVARATEKLIAAAFQIIATAQIPSTTISQISSGGLLSAALRVASASCVAEILRESGPEGCHVEDICKANGLDPRKLGRILRILSNYHIFREISPNVFAHTSTSSTLDTGKSSKDVLENPQNKYDGAKGISAKVERTTDEVFKAAAYLMENLQDPKTRFSEELNETPFNRAMKSNLTPFEWYEEQGNEFRSKRFDAIDSQSRRSAPPDDIFQGFNWGSLPMGSIIVDIGGATGSVSLAVAKIHPSFQFIIQDRKKILEIGHKYWAERLPEALTSGRVVFQPHDFFHRQPENNAKASVFLMRFILNSLGDKLCQQILRNLYEAATSDTRLIVIDHVVPYACCIPIQSAMNEIEGIGHLDVNTNPQSPLLPNFGHVSWMPCIMDLHLITFFNGQARTLGGYWELLKSTGWKIQIIHRMGYPGVQQIVAVPSGKIPFST